jgi:8-oxo-dGTP pyrophosphatase MutT (NUDIX family)
MAVRDVNDRPETAEIFPQQAAVIPMRSGVLGGMEICLIRRKIAAKWGIPKGFIERGQTWSETALNEAFEEAGVCGRVVGDSIGSYEYQKGVVTLTVVVFVMEVVDEQTSWPESRWRERQWCSVDTAKERLERHRVRPLLDRLPDSLP